MSKIGNKLNLEILQRKTLSDCEKKGENEPVKGTVKTETYKPTPPLYANFYGRKGESFQAILKRLHDQRVSFTTGDKIFLLSEDGGTCGHFEFDGKRWNGTYE